MPDKRIHTFLLNLDGDLSEGRAPADHIVLPGGHYRIDQETMFGGYNPFSPSSDGRTPHWFHELHLAFIPLTEEGRSASAVRHMCVRNRLDPGPYLDMITARAAFRAIPAEQRCFKLLTESSVVWWIQAGENGDEWQKGRYCYGTLHLALYRLEP